MKYRFKKPFIKLYRRSKINSGKVFSRLLNEYNYQSLSTINEKDFVMAGYPKSGNTWMQNLLAGILYGIDTQYLPDSLTQELIPDLDYKIFYKRLNPSLCFKTHGYPKKEFRNVIHLVRDPRDVMASYYAMMIGQGKNVTFNDVIVEQENLRFGTWSEHSQAWLNNPFNARVHRVKYEDILEEPREELKKILNFMNLIRSDELIDRVIEGNSLTMMKKKEKELGFDKHFMRSWKEGHSFVRTGEKGTGKKEIPQKLITYLEEQCKEQMKVLGYN